MMDKTKEDDRDREVLYLAGSDACAYPCASRRESEIKVIRNMREEACRRVWPMFPFAYQVPTLVGFAVRRSAEMPLRHTQGYIYSDSPSDTIADSQMIG